MPIAGDYTLRCRRCEGKISRPVVVNPTIYGVQPNRHGAVIRKCKECGQLWLGYVQQLPNQRMKIVQKAIDKIL